MQQLAIMMIRISLVTVLEGWHGRRCILGKKDRAFVLSQPLACQIHVQCATPSRLFCHHSCGVLLFKMGTLPKSCTDSGQLNIRSCRLANYNNRWAASHGPCGPQCKQHNPPACRPAKCVPPSAACACAVWCPCSARLCCQPCQQVAAVGTGSFNGMQAHGSIRHTTATTGTGVEQGARLCGTAHALRPSAVMSTPGCRMMSCVLQVEGLDP